VSISLKKGQKISLKKDNGESLSEVMVALGWDYKENRLKKKLFGIFNTDAVDCDAIVILCSENGKLIPGDINDYCVYYGGRKNVQGYIVHPSGSIIHKGDDLVGGGKGDNEQILISLDRVPSNIHRIVFAVNIYRALERDQHFGMLKDAFIRVVNVQTNQEFCRFDLAENYDRMTGLIAGEFYRRDNKWNFNAIGNGISNASSVRELCRRYA